MLGSQDFSRSHHGGLVTVLRSKIGTGGGNHCLAGTNVPTCSSRFIGTVRHRSARQSSIARCWALVSSNGKKREKLSIEAGFIGAAASFLRGALDPPPMPSSDQKAPRTSAVYALWQGPLHRRESGWIPTPPDGCKAHWLFGWRQEQIPVQPFG